MSETPYSLEVAIRADEKAKAAHERLDRMNGSIDKLAGQVSETNGKIDAIATAIARSDGIDQGEQAATRRFLDSRRFNITTIILLLGAVATLAYMAFGH